MISLADLAALHDTYAEDLARPMTPVSLPGLVIGDGMTAVMGTVNLSRDSTYRESVAVSTESAIRKARVQIAQGAGVVDIGAESSTGGAARVGAADQVAALVPVVEGLADDVVVSVETYQPSVVKAALDAGAGLLNLTGRDREEEILTLAAEYGAAVVLCFCELDDLPGLATLELGRDPIPYFLDHFGPRLERARALGAERLLVDPGLGFYANLTDPVIRVDYQTRVLAQCFRLSPLGVPVCNAMPHAFDLFEDEFRKAEGFFAVLAALGGSHLFRTHEVPHVAAVLGAMRALSVGPQSD